MKYCPQCGAPISTRSIGGRVRPACAAEGCGFVHFGDFSIGCAGVVTRELKGVTKALLIQRGHEPFAGMWQIPGGYAEHDELLSTAVEREVLEESGIVATVHDIIGVRHALGGGEDGPATNLYLVFRLDYRSGEVTTGDDDEVAQAGFYSLAEMGALEGLQGLSKWAIEQVLRREAGSGLRMGAIDERSESGRWQLFGLAFPEQ